MARKTGQPFKERPATPGLSEFHNIRIGATTLRLRFYGDDLDTLKRAGAVYGDDGALLAKVKSLSEDELVLTIGGLDFCPNLPGHWPYTVQIMHNMVNDFHKLFGVKRPLAEMFEAPNWQIDCQLQALAVWTIDEIEADRMLINDADPQLKKIPEWLKFIEEYSKQNPVAKRKPGKPKGLTPKSEFTMAAASTARNRQLDSPEMTEAKAIEKALEQLPKQNDSSDREYVIQNYLRKMKKRY